ncbi:MAG: RsmB/NOP family class I SAM-dependent RNA methyltransferase [Erysipelotrichaceae bacterium]|nr:RsmB/NOP family class I SAM-dependent RNA methyltransferase [Erysipelotrichaceae bacterium]
MKLPEKYQEKMKELLKDEYEIYLDSFKEKRVYGLRVNTLKISVKNFLKINPFHLTPIPWTDDGFYYEEEDQPSKHPYYFAGLYYLQEPSAMYPAQALEIQKGDVVLDCCAAPGGKSLKLACKLDKSGTLISNDISVSRCQVLLKNLESHGVINSIVMAQDIAETDNFDSCFDKILIDVPCSGEGMFRKEPELIRSWLEKDSSYYAPIQKKIIAKALEMAKDGAMILYSTCTFDPREDEEIIEYALDLCPELKVLPLDKKEGFMPGITDRTQNCVRLYPHKIKGEGHFIALLQKGEANDIQRSTLPLKKLSLEDFDLDLPEGKLIKRKERLFYEMANDLDLSGLRILRSGLFLGEYSHERFQPSQALAMALNSKQYDNILDLPIEDQRVIKYLKCETLDVKDKYVNGLVLVCVDGFPLGFGKAGKGLLKNLYPANYRYK